LKPIADPIRSWFLSRGPFRKEWQTLLERIDHQEEQIHALVSLLGVDRRQRAQLGLLTEVAQKLKTVLDQPVSAQLAVNAIRRAYDCPLVTVLKYDAGHGEFALLASATRSNGLLPPSYRQRADRGIAGRARRLRKTQLVNDTRRDPDYARTEENIFASELAVPLIQDGRVKGVLVVRQDNPGAFSNSDIATIETAADLLLEAWERSDHQRRLTEFIRASIALSTTLGTQATIDQVATISCQTFGARFVFVTLLDQEGSFTRLASAGHAPGLLRALKADTGQDPLIREILHTEGIVRLRDFRKDDRSSHLKADQAGLKSLLAFPIRLHQLSVGVVLVFGKRDQPTFSENDEALARLVASQAGAAVESAWLYQELRSTLHTTTSLYQLSIRIIQAEDLSEAAEAIAETAFRLGHAAVTGIVLYTPAGQVEARVEVDGNGTVAGNSHPLALIEQAMETGQTIIFAGGRNASRVCIPLQTSRRTYGALWFDISEELWYNARYAANLQTLTNQATIALERSILLAETRNQAGRLKLAYQELEDTYDQTLGASCRPWTRATARPRAIVRASAPSPAAWGENSDWPRTS